MTDISDTLDALHSDPSPVSRIVSKILDDITGRVGFTAAWDATPPRRQVEIVEQWERLVHEAMADADTTVSPSGMIRVHIQPSGGDRDRMAAEARTVTAALTQAFDPDNAKSDRHSIESREQFNACPTGTVIRAQGGTLYLVGETAPDGRLRLHPLEPETRQTYAPAAGVQAQARAVTEQARETRARTERERDALIREQDQGRERGR